MRGLPVLLLLLAACGPAADDTWVARVDGREVSMAELQRASEPRLGEASGAERDVIWAEELERLVVDRLILNRATELGVEVSDAEVDGRVQLVHGADFETPGPGYRDQVRREMTLERAALVDLASKAQVPEAAVVEHFASNPERYQHPERIQIRQIVVEDREKAESLRAELEAGAEFVRLARVHSLAPEAKKGGLLPPFARGEMPEVFDKAFDLKPGKPSPVVDSSYGFHIFTLVEKLPAREVELGEVREEILVELQRDKLEELKRGWLHELRRAAKIEVNERVLESAK